VDDRGDHERPQSYVDLGRSHLGAVGRDDEIARQHQPEATGQSVPVDARHDRQSGGTHAPEELADLGPLEVLTDA
jgi:hypothetical protein